MSSHANPPCHGSFARDLGYGGDPFIWEEEERRHLRARLDVLYFHLYVLDSADAAYVLDTFPIVRREDQAQFAGRYRTKDLILAYMNALAAGTPRPWWRPSRRNGRKRQPSRHTMPESETETSSMNEYEIALSFAGEQRCYVEQVALAIQSRGISVFYDEFEKVPLWGKHAAGEFQQVYERRANMVVMFISREYVDKAWPRHERRSILSRSVHKSCEFILPVRFDDTEVPGLAGDMIYLCAEEYSPAEIGAMAIEKLGVGRFEGKASQVPPPRMTSLAGEAVFDYSNHDGRYKIGRDTLEFETQWSKASDTSIHVYNDPPSINGIALAARRLQLISQVVNAESLDYTSRARTPRLGEIVLFRNTHGFYAAVQVLAIKDDTRGDDCDELRFRYVIQPDGLDSFGEFDADG